MKKYFESTCNVTSTVTDVTVEAEADNVKPGEFFNAYIASNRIRMNWNGKVYVGRVANMEFTSDGPKEIN